MSKSDDEELEVEAVGGVTLFLLLAAAIAAALSFFACLSRPFFSFLSTVTVMLDSLLNFLLFLVTCADLRLLLLLVSVVRGLLEVLVLLPLRVAGLVLHPVLEEPDSSQLRSCSGDNVEMKVSLDILLPIFGFAWVLLEKFAGTSFTAGCSGDRESLTESFALVEDPDEPKGSSLCTPNVEAVVCEPRMSWGSPNLRESRPIVVPPSVDTSSWIPVRTFTACEPLK